MPDNTVSVLVSRDDYIARLNWPLLYMLIEISSLYLFSKTLSRS
jgi:hypothetical protein